MKYGSIPAGGLGTRLQPLGFSKELAPVAHKAVIEYLIERMLLAGIDKIFINTAEDKTDCQTDYSLTPDEFHEPLHKAFRYFLPLPVYTLHASRKNGLNMLPWRYIIH